MTFCSGMLWFFLSATDVPEIMGQSCDWGLGVGHRAVPALVQYVARRVASTRGEWGTTASGALGGRSHWSVVPGADALGPLQTSCWRLCSPWQQRLQVSTAGSSLGFSCSPFPIKWFLWGHPSWSRDALDWGMSGRGWNVSFTVLFTVGCPCSLSSAQVLLLLCCNPDLSVF